MGKKIMTDEERGYRDRLAGYYDKWFRYNRVDNGAAYDKGCVRAVDSGKCPDHFTLIEASEILPFRAGEEGHLDPPLRRLLRVPPAHILKALCIGRVDEYIGPLSPAR